MSIVKKTILIVVCTTVALFSLVYLISNFIYLKGFRDLEIKTVEQDTRLVTKALSVKLETLDSFCQDWSSWDDTYYFGEEYYQEYVDRNLSDQTFIVGDINIFLVINTRGEMVYGKSYDIINERETALPAGLPGSLTDALSVKSGDTEPAISGITMLSGQPMLIVARPLLTSLDEGPSTGSLIMGRFLDAAVIDSLSETTGLSVELLTLQMPEINPELDEIIGSLSDADSIYVETQGDIISGYTLISDITGNPAFVFKVTVPRDMYAQGIGTVAYLHSSLLLISIVFCVVFVLLIRYFILSRLTALGKAVNVIGTRGDVTSRVSVRGKDELSELADNINNMLGSLEKSEIRRQSQKEFIGHIVNNTPSGVLAIDDAGCITLINEAFQTMFDLRSRIVMGIRLEDLPELADIASEVKKFRESRAVSLRKELQYVQDGVNKIYIASFARLKEEELYILYLTDISEERARQESMYLTDRLASIGEMASGIAHELNNPLTSIIGLSEIVSMEDIPENVREDIGLIKSESHRAANIVRNLLSFARKNATVKQFTDINKVVLDVLKLRSYEHGVHNIEIVQELDHNLPEILIDYSQIQQVFINIILNAEHAMITAHGKGTLKIKTEKADGMIKASFTDDGVGIESHNLRRIFDPFFTTKEAGKGTGLGLSISYGIVTAHNGRIYATSEPGKGATFVVELPLNDTGAEEKKQDAQ